MDTLMALSLTSTPIMGLPLLHPKLQGNQISVIYDKQNFIRSPLGDLIIITFADNSVIHVYAFCILVLNRKIPRGKGASMN